MPFINRELAELEDDAKCASLSKLVELVKKSSNLIRTRKEKLHCPIAHSMAYFVESVRRPCFCFAKSLMDLTDGLAMGRAELRGGEVTVGFFG